MPQCLTTGCFYSRCHSEIALFFIFLPQDMFVLLMSLSWILVCIFVKENCLSLYFPPVRVAHPLANRRASGAVFWKDAWHLAPSSWLLAVGWYRNVSFLRWRSEKLSIWKSNVITYDRGGAAGLLFSNCEERYETVIFMNLSSVFIWRNWWGSLLSALFVFFDR